MEESSAAPSPEAGTQHFLGKGCLLPWEQAISLTHYLLLSVGTNRCAALHASEGEDSTLCPALAPLLPPDGLRGGSWLGTGGLRIRRVALNLCPYLLPIDPECPQLLRGTVGDMLGLEAVRLGALLESSHQALLLQQCSVHWLQLGLMG